ncbi:MAG: AIR synthase family protein [Candidatus Bathyarchaeia archaeon]
MGGLKTGKVPPDKLMELVFGFLGRPDPRVLVGPGIGEDAAVIDMGDASLVLAMDPITAASRDLGWLSVHINANDVATRGAVPKWFLCAVLLPEGSDEGELEEIMGQMDRAAKELGVAIVGGHTEVAPGIRAPIVIGMMAGECPKGRHLSTRGAKPGDRIIMTKTAGIEGTAVISISYPDILKVPADVIERSKGFLRSISVVEEALVAAGIEGVHSLHDPTEGGILGGVWEMAAASGLGALIEAARVPIAEETRTICESLGIDPMKLLGSGSLLISVDPRAEDELLRSLRRRGIRATGIGEMRDGAFGVKLIDSSGCLVEIRSPPRDSIYEVIELYEAASRGDCRWEGGS